MSAARLQLLLLAAGGIWAAAVPYLAHPLGLAVDVRPVVEVVDHVVPGALIVAAVAVALAVGNAERPGLMSTLAAGTALVAGVWVTSTHVPLVAEAADGTAAWDAAIWHTAPGPVLVGLSLWALLARREARAQ